MGQHYRNGLDFSVSAQIFFSWMTCRTKLDEFWKILQTASDHRPPPSPPLVVFCVFFSTIHDQYFSDCWASEMVNNFQKIIFLEQSNLAKSLKAKTHQALRVF